MAASRKIPAIGRTCGVATVRSPPRRASAVADSDRPGRLAGVAWRAEVRSGAHSAGGCARRPASSAIEPVVSKSCSKFSSSVVATHINPRSPCIHVQADGAKYQ